MLFRSINICQSEQTEKWLALAACYGAAILIDAELVSLFPDSRFQKQNIYHILRLDGKKALPDKAWADNTMSEDPELNLALDMTTLRKGSIYSTYEQLKKLKMLLVITDYHSFMEEKNA